MTTRTSPTLEAWARADVEAIHHCYQQREGTCDLAGLVTAVAVADLTEYYTGMPTPELSILDVGAGVGRITRHFKEWGHVGIVEPNAEFRAKAALRCATRELYVTTDAVADRDWDVVFSYLVLQHYPTHERRNLLTEMARATRHLLLIQMPLYNVAREPEHWSDVGTWTLDELGEFADAIGFTIREAHPVHGVYEPSWTLAQVPAAHFDLHVLERNPDGEK